MPINHEPRCRIIRICLTGILGAVAFAPQALFAGEVVGSYREKIAPVLEDVCFDCHGGGKSKGGVSFDQFDDDRTLLSARELWRKAREAVAFGAMPPKDETQLLPEERERITSWISTKIETPDPSNPLYQDPGPRMIRQLSRDEYRRTVTDLLGLSWQDPASQAGIPNERPVEGFENLAGAMNIDPSLLEKYFLAAEISLERFLNEGRERDRIFFVKPDEAAGVSAREAASQVLAKFVAGAYRRPIEAREWERLMPLFENALAAGDSYERALTKAMKPVLTSPNFLYRLERPPAAADGDDRRFQRVSDHELAVRLSYFLWSTMPDAELTAAADSGELSKPEVLASEVARMLAHDKARALTENFGVQWLKLRRLDRALPQQNIFPSYSGDLKRAMNDEVFRFFDNLRKENRSVRELIDSDYTFVNSILAQHYGIVKPEGDDWQQVALKPVHHRGGLLGMAGLLTATSHTDRTRPTARGAWILEVLLGTPTSPPPANAGSFEKKEGDAAAAPEPVTFREKLAQHAHAAECASCHKKMDPLGFALENYDAIGAWRESVGDRPVDNLGTLPTGENIVGVDGLKEVMKAREEEIVKNLIRQLLAYALGREPEFFDELAVSEIAAATKPGGYRFADITTGIAMSLPFQNQRAASAVAENEQIPD